MKPGKFRLVVISTNRNKYSETFIHDSFRSFHCEKVLLHGGYLPTFSTGSLHEEGNAIPQLEKKWWQGEKNLAEALGDDGLRLFRYLRTYKPNAVLAHYGPSGVKMLPVCKALGIPLIVHFHGYDAWRSDVLESYGKKYPELFRGAAGLVAVSEEMKKQLIGLGAEAKKISLLYYGADIDFFRWRPMQEDAPVFAFVGRFVEKKDPKLLIRAFSAALKDIPEARLVMAGDGELLPECIKLAEESGISKSVEFPGILSREEVWNLLVRSRALILPSRQTGSGDAEGAPLVVFEAGATCRPVIATRHGGIPEIVVHGQSGHLIEPENLSALTEEIVRFSKNHEMAAKMGYWARLHIKDHFSQNRYHQALWNLITKAGRYR